MFFNKQNDSICRAVLYSVIIAILLFLYKDNPFFKKSKIMVIVDLFFFPNAGKRVATVNWELLIYSRPLAGI